MQSDVKNAKLVLKKNILEKKISEDKEELRLLTKKVTFYTTLVPLTFLQRWIRYLIRDRYIYLSLISLAGFVGTIGGNLSLITILCMIPFFMFCIVLNYSIFDKEILYKLEHLNTKISILTMCIDEMTIELEM